MYNTHLSSFPGWLLLVIIPLAIWSAIWKGIALWRAGRDGSLAWFIVMFIINTVGILEIIYIFAVSRQRRRAAGAVPQIP